MLTIFLAALAALGLGTIFWLIWGLFLIPVGTIGTVHIRVLASGDAQTLEHTLSGLLWLQRSGLLEAQIDIVDAGLDETGRICAIRLVHVHPGTRLLCPDTWDEMTCK